MKLRPSRRYTIVVGLLQALGLAIVAAISLYMWLSPTHLLLAFALGVVVPMIGIAWFGSFVFDPEESESGLVGDEAPPVGQRMMTGVLPVVAWAVVFGSLAACWYLPSVRAEGVAVATDYRWRAAVESALFDDVSRVAYAACEGLAEIGAEESQVVVAARLQEASPRMTRCLLDQVISGSDAHRVVTWMIPTWAERVESDDVGAGAACRVADYLREADRIGIPSAAPYLYRCAVVAETAEARGCCAQSLRARFGSRAHLDMILPEPSALVASRFAGAAPALLRASYSDAPETAQIRQKLALQGPGQRRWVLGFGCATLETRHVELRDAVAEAMADVLASRGCRVPPAEETTVRIWTAACNATLNDPDGRGREPSDMLCEEVEALSTADAVNQAHAMLHRSIRAGLHPGRGRRLMESLADYSAVAGREQKQGATRVGDAGKATGQIGPPTNGDMMIDGMVPSPEQLVPKIFHDMMTERQRKMTGGAGDAVFRLLEAARQKDSPPGKP